MTTTLIVVGRTVERYLQTGIDEYSSRLGHYGRFDLAVIPDLKNAKNLSEAQIRKTEGEQILNQLTTSDHVVLLDERGAMRSSPQMAEWMQSIMNRGIKRLVFVIGGAYGFADEVYARANEKMSLSPMTFSHQMVRMIFAEQLYRAHTILNNQPYHHS